MAVKRIHYSDADRRRMDDIMPFDTCPKCGDDMAIHEWHDIDDDTMDVVNCDRSEGDKAIDWLMAVRKYGLEKANEMFPSD